MFVFVALGGIGCRPQQERSDKLFTLMSESVTSIDFANMLAEDDRFNIVEYLYFYNGGGVAIGDLNGDGLPEIVFTGNQVQNRLYLNEGNWKFRDITDQSGIEGVGNWKTGVVMADVNADGWLDIYVCGVGNYKGFDTPNQLYVNNGDLTFTERSEEFGLNFKGFSTQAGFLDYDIDGDLDMYLLNHSVHTQRSYGNTSFRAQQDSLAGDRLFKNLLMETGVSRFEDVTTQAGILSSQLGYGLGLGIGDVNNDGYPDIYVSNDFHENDYLYINSQDGTFTQEARRALPHTSRFSMGNDIADVNNDGWLDIITLDMLPRDESVIKTSAGEDSYEVYKFKLSYGFDKQVSRNALQLNRGSVDSGSVVFSDVAQAAGVEATDWSWCPLLVDWDGDGRKDIFVTNGIVKRPNDLDYISYMSDDSVQRLAQNNHEALVDLMPSGSARNFAFRNLTDLRFEDVGEEWGLNFPGFSNGAAYGDLDLDGDPDLVVNQLNGQALVYRNNSSPSAFLSINLNSPALRGNPWAVGARVTVTVSGKSQMSELYPERGWLSSSDYKLFFAKGDSQIAEVEVRWPDGSISDHKVSGDTTLSYRPREKQAISGQRPNQLLEAGRLPEIIHREDNFNAFNRESLIPHMLTTEGPALAVGDVNQDGLEDFFIGGAKDQPGALYLQSTGGGLRINPVRAFLDHAKAEDVDAEFFDADGDGDLDLLVVSGGQEAIQELDLIAPRLYMNDGKGNFTHNPNSFPGIYLNASCVQAADIDNDGDIDLFLGASVMPYLYGMAPQSYLLVNRGGGSFENRPNWLAGNEFSNPSKFRPGMIKDGQWLDLNDDNLMDLVLVGEWMPITILIQRANYRFEDQTNQWGLAGSAGLWNTIEVADLDGDGDSDMIAGNLGVNSRIRASKERPLTMFLGDFDSNGGSDHILVYYNGDVAYPFASRDQLIKQVPSFKKKFPRYRDYQNVKLEDIITPAQKGNSASLVINELRSMMLIQDSSRFVQTPLPMEAQYFPVFGIHATDLNEDANLDLMLVGNFSSTQPDFGSYDAGLGVVLLGDGLGNFSPLPPESSGFVVKGEGRVIKPMTLGGKKLWLVARNNASLLGFKIKNKKP